MKSFRSPPRPHSTAGRRGSCGAAQAVNAFALRPPDHVVFTGAISPAAPINDSAPWGARHGSSSLPRGHICAQPSAREGELGRDIVLNDLSLRAAVLHRRGAPTRGGGGGGAELIGRPFPQAPRPLHITVFVCFSPYLGVFSGGGGVPRGLGHSLRVQFSSLCTLKLEIHETDFFDMLAIFNDQTSCVIFLSSLCVFHPIWVLEGTASPVVHIDVMAVVPCCAPPVLVVRVKRVTSVMLHCALPLCAMLCWKTTYAGCALAPLGPPPPPQKTQIG